MYNLSEIDFIFKKMKFYGLTEVSMIIPILNGQCNRDITDLMYSTLAGMWYLDPASKCCSQRGTGDLMPWYSSLKADENELSSHYERAFVRARCLPKLPPSAIVIVWGRGAIENIPAPLVHDVSEGQENDLGQGHLEQIVDRSFKVVDGRCTVQKADFPQVLRCDDRESEGVSCDPNCAPLIR